MRRRALFLALCLVMLFSACSAIQEDHTTLEISDVNYSFTLSGGSERVIMPSLYFPDKSKSKLAAEVREIVVRQDESEAEAIVSTMLEGPANSADLSSLGTGISLDCVEIMEEVANVYLLCEYDIGEKNEFYVGTAIADTLIDYLSVSYVNLFIDGNALSVGGFPCGVLQKSSGNIQDLYQGYEARVSSQYISAADHYEINVSLYFLDRTGMFIQPEVRKIAVPFHNDAGVFRQNFVLSILKELAEGPKSHIEYRACIDAQALTEDKITVAYDENGRMHLGFAVYPFTTQTKKIDRAACASIYYSLASVLQDMPSIKTSFENRFLILTRGNMAPYAGSNIKLYFPNKEMDALIEASRTVRCSEMYALSTYMRELLKGPIVTDGEEIGASYTSTVDAGMINDIVFYADSNAVCIDLSRRFLDQLKALDEEAERMAVYSIVNTFCSKPYIKCVQFLVEGAREDVFVDKIHIKYPLMPSPGLLK